MDESFTRLSAPVNLGPPVFWVTLVLMLAGSVVLIRNWRQRPYALVCFTIIVSLLALTSGRRVQWMERSLVVGCVASLAILAVQWNRKDQGWRRLRVLRGPFGMALGILLMAPIAPGVTKKNICLHQEFFSYCDGGKPSISMNLVEIEEYSSAVVLHFGAGQEFEISYLESYRNSAGEVLSGRTVADEVTSWIRKHPYHPPGPPPALKKQTGRKLTTGAPQTKH